MTTLHTSEGTVALPAGWDSAVDLVVVTGDESLVAAERLHARGLRRVLALTTDPRPDLPFHTASDAGGLYTALAAMSEPPPTRIVYSERGAKTEGLLSTAEVKAIVDQSVSLSHTARMTQEQFGSLWARQAIENMPALARSVSIDALRSLARGRPVIVVCPGPSLAKNVHELAAWKDRALLVVVSHALHPVVRAGITPDVVIAVDPQDLSHHFAGLALQSIPVVALELGVHPALFALAPNHVVPFVSSSVSEDWMADAIGTPIPRLPAGGSVTHAAASLGLHLEASTLIFVGMDLAYPGGRLYVETSIDGDARIERTEGRDAHVVGWGRGTSDAALGGSDQSRLPGMMEVRGWDGAPVPTSYQFHLFRVWLERLRAEHPSTRFVNATEGGSYVDGFEHVPLASLATLRDGTERRSADEALARFREEDATPTSARARDAALALDARMRVLDDIKTRATRCVRTIERGGEGLQRAFLARAAGRSPSGPDARALIELEQNEAKIGNAVRPLKDLTLALQAPIRDVQRMASRLRPEHALQAKLALYRAVAHASEALRDACAAALTRCKSEAA